MKCPSCGAEIGTNKVCEFCGSTITSEMQREAEQLRKEGCPKCGSSNITFRRENQGEVRGKNQKAVIHRTVGLCKDCGFTWYPNDAEIPKPKRKTWLWVLGWICIFPLPLTLIMLKKKDMKPALRYGIIAAAWILYGIIAMTGESQSDKQAQLPESSTSQVESVESSTSQTGNTSNVSENNGEEIPVVYEDNKKINLFINNYNEGNSNEKIESTMIEKDYHHGKVHDNQINILNEDGIEINLTDSSAYFQVFIKGKNLEDDIYKQLVFKYAKGYDTSLNDETLEKYWEQTIADTIYKGDFDEFVIRLYMFQDKIEYLTIQGKVKE